MATTVTLKPNAIDISGSTSGTTTLQATAVAGTTTITLPAATDTLVGKATTDTLTNKTLTTPTINQFSSASATNLTIQSAGTTAVTIDTSQNVGISVTPSAWKSTLKALQIGGYTSLFNQPSNTDLGCNLYINSSGQAIYLNSDSATLYEMSGGVHAWYRASSGTAGNVATLNESMRIDSSGNVCINSTSVVGAEKLGVKFDGSTINGIGVQTTASSSGDGFVVFRNSSGTAIGTISRNGSTNAVQYNTTSDYRLKENVTPLNNALARVSELKPVQWVWKDCDGATGEGFIAHEVQEVVPSAVSGVKDAVDEDGNIKPQGMDASYLVATLTAAIQELKAINDQQAETINALTARVVALESK